MRILIIIIAASMILMPSTVTSQTSKGSVRIFTANGVSFSMMPIKGGTFGMGLDADMQFQLGVMDENSNREKPRHQVNLKSFYIGQTEVTQALWEAVMGDNPSNHRDNPNLPGENVTWDECQAFIKKLNGITGQKFRLPTEAEWEYAACDGGFPMNRGKKIVIEEEKRRSNLLLRNAWYEINSGDSTHVVATLQPSERFNLYDMIGNVWEWCQDTYDKYYYQRSPVDNPCNTSWDVWRVIRGGCCKNDRTKNRPTCRLPADSSTRNIVIGLRLASDW